MWVRGTPAPVGVLERNKKSGKSTRAMPPTQAQIIQEHVKNERRADDMRRRQQQEEAATRAREVAIARHAEERAAKEQWHRQQAAPTTAPIETAPVVPTVAAPAPIEAAPIASAAAAPDVPRAPPEFLCPITTEVMRFPVMAADGHTYERDAITDWLTSNNTSPMTLDVLENKKLIPNHAMRAHAQRFLDECEAAGVDPNSLVDDA